MEKDLSHLTIRCLDELDFVPPSGPINLTPPPLESVGSEPATDPTISLWSLPFFTMFLSMDLV